MPQRIELLLIILALSSSATHNRMIESQESDEVAWIEEESFRIVMSWCSEQTELINVLIIHSGESSLVHRHSSRFISSIHAEFKNSVTTSRRIVGTKNSRLNGRKVSIGFPRTMKDSGKVPRSPEGTPRENVAIILVPDEATFFDFLSGSTAWHSSKLAPTLIILIPETDFLCQKNAGNERWETSANNILRRIWSESEILNVFLIAPSSPCVKDYLFAWDPFDVRADGSTGSLKSLIVAGNSCGVDGKISRFLNSVENTNGYPLRVAIFQRVPTAFVEPESGQWSDYEKAEDIRLEELTGLDGLVLRTITASMNWTVYFHPPSNNAEYGYQTGNGTFVGAIGDIIYGRVDFAANGVYLKDYETASATEFTIPIGWDSICVVVPRADIIPIWLQTFLCFTPLVWGLMLMNIAICSLARYMMRLAMEEQRRRGVFLILFTETALMFVSLPRKLPRGNAERTLLGFWFLFGIIVMGTFQGTLYDSLTNPRRYRELNTLAELDESGLKIGTGSPNLKDIFGQENVSSTLTNLHRKVEISDNQEIGTIDRAAWKKDIAAFERKNDLYLSINTKFLNDRGNAVLHTIQECPRSYHLAYIVPSGAFYLRRMNTLLRRMFEAGLPTYWYNSTVDSLILKHRYSVAKKHSARGQAVAFNFFDLQTSFIILACGLFLSILVFIGEAIRFY